MKKQCEILFAALFALSILSLLSSCGQAPPPKLPPTSQKTKLVNGNLQIVITSIIHPNCPLASFTNVVLPAFSGGDNSADKLYLRDDDGPGKDDDVSLNLDILVGQPVNNLGPKYLKAPWDAPKYNIITDSEDSIKLAGTTDFGDWLIIVQSLPASELARGAQGHARMIVATSSMWGDVIAHELGHNFGLEHRVFKAANGKIAIMNPSAGSARGDGCLITPEEKSAIIKNLTAP